MLVAEQIHSKSSQDKAGINEKMKQEGWRNAKCEEWGCREADGESTFRVAECIWQGVQDVRIKEMQRLMKQGMLEPGNSPNVLTGVTVCYGVR